MSALFSLICAGFSGKFLRVKQLKCFRLFTRCRVLLDLPTRGGEVRGFAGRVGFVSEQVLRGQGFFHFCFCWNRLRRRFCWFFSVAQVEIVMSSFYVKSGVVVAFSL